MKEQDLNNREIVRQSRSLAMGNRLSAGSAGSASSSTSSTSTRVVDGAVLRLFIPNADPLNDANYYLGDAPVYETTEGPTP